MVLGLDASVFLPPFLSAGFGAREEFVELGFLGLEVGEARGAEGGGGGLGGGEEGFWGGGM